MSGPSALPPPGVCTPDQLLPSGQPKLGTKCMEWTNEQAQAAAPPPPPPAPAKDEAKVPAKGEAAEEYSFLDDPVRWIGETIQAGVNMISPTDEITTAVEGAGKPQE